MKLDITYPPAKKRVQRRRWLNIVRWPLLFAAYICPIVNLLTGGKAWSVIVLMGLYMLWTLVLSPQLVEYNRISQSIRVITSSCTMLLLIDALLAPGWAMEVVPLVCTGGLITASTLFFTDPVRQRSNLLPLLLVIVLCCVGSALGLAVWHGPGRWTLVVLGLTASCLLVAVIAMLGADFPRELKRRFHIK